MIWDAVTGQAVHNFVHDSRIGGLTFSPDGRWLAGGPAGRNVATNRTGHRCGSQSPLLAVGLRDSCQISCDFAEVYYADGEKPDKEFRAMINAVEDTS